MANLKSVWGTIRSSLKSEHHDFTALPISTAVILLAIPMILELSLEGVFAVVDMFFVSRLGADAIATVALTEAMVSLIYAIGIGLSTAATAIVARRIGEKNPEAAAHAGAQALILSLFVSFVLGLFGFVFAADILKMMGASPDVIASGAVFTRILLGFNFPIILLFLINGVFRGAGDANMAMRSLWIASGLNIVFCPIFIAAFGLKGAALATVIGRSGGVLYQCRHLFKGDGELKFLRRHFAFDSRLMKSLGAVAWPASVQYLIGSGSWIVLTRLVAETGGTIATAGYQIAFRNFIFFMLPAWGLSNAAATLVGQNLGAKQFARAEQAAVTTAKYSAIMNVFFTFLFTLGAPLLIRFYTQDPQVAIYGREAMQGIGVGFIFYGIGMVMSQALNGAGATKAPTWINVFCFWIFQTPLAYFLAEKTSLGAHGIIYSIPLSHALLAVMAWFVFKRGKWKDVRV